MTKDELRITKNRDRNAAGLRHSSFVLRHSNALEGTRTPGLQVRNLSLYPLSYERK